MQGFRYIIVHGMNSVIVRVIDLLVPYNGGKVLSCSAPRTAVAQCLRCCYTNRKVAGSIPDNVIGIFIDIILPIALWR